MRIHDIRHSFASRALALGESLSMIGKLLGHTKIDTTSRYAHLAQDSIKASSARVADSIGADILDRKPREAATVGLTDHEDDRFGQRSIRENARR